MGFKLFRYRMLPSAFIYLVGPRNFQQTTLKSDVFGNVQRGHAQ